MTVVFRAKVPAKRLLSVRTTMLHHLRMILVLMLGMLALNGLPMPYSDDPTQWLFHSHPVPSERPLQVAIARLLGYRWPAETDEEMELAPEVPAAIDVFVN